MYNLLRLVAPHTPGLLSRIYSTPSLLTLVIELLLLLGIFSPASWNRAILHVLRLQQKLRLCALFLTSVKETCCEEESPSEDAHFLKRLRGKYLHRINHFINEIYPSLVLTMASDQVELP